MPNTYTILSVICHFISKEGKHWYIILGLREVINKHSSENITGILIALFKEYNISKNIKYFMTNNMEVNNIYINTVLQALYLGISVKKQKAC